MHVFGEYKCLKCHYFHIGRTQKKTDNTDLFQEPVVRMSPEPKPEKEVVDLFAEINPNLRVVNVVEPEVVPEVKVLEFDWDNLTKKTIGKIDSYYHKLYK